MLNAKTDFLGYTVIIKDNNATSINCEHFT